MSNIQEHEFIDFQIKSILQILLDNKRNFK